MSESPEFPGIPSVQDGSGAVVWVETQISEAATAYPITPSTNMGVGYQELVSNGAKNLWDTPLSFVELESEHSAASSCEGFAMAGGRVSNFTSGQGLILMKEVLYTIAGKRLPVVFNIGARALTYHSLNVHCGHDDVMGVADTGWGMLFGRNAQEAADLSLIARRTAEDSFTPFFNVQDGFLTTHTLENILLPEPELMKRFVGDPAARLSALFDPRKPQMVGVVQNQDSYMKGRVAQREIFAQVKHRLMEAFAEFKRLTGRSYGMISTVGLEDADYAIIGLGSSMETVEAALPLIRQRLGLKVGLIHVTSFRPFPAEELVEAVRGLRAVAVIERADEPLASDNPLTRELKAAFYGAEPEGRERLPRILSGIYGMGSRDFRMQDVLAIAKALAKPDSKPFFVSGVKHVLGLEADPADAWTGGEGDFSMRGHSVGGYGSVTTNKILASIGADIFGLKVQAYPKYGSEKKGLPTTYYLTFSPKRVLTHFELSTVDFVVVNDINAFRTANPLSGLKKGGTLFLQSGGESAAAVWASLPPEARKNLKYLGAKVYYLDSVKVARELAPSADLAQRMQGIVLLGVFLRMTPYREKMGITTEALFEKLHKPLEKYFGRRGASVVEANLNAAKRGFESVEEITKAVMDQEPAAALGGKS